jgi:ribose-phosphate pyrophosphokinase
VSAADIAKMLETAGCDRVISVELQPAGASQIDGFFALPVENLRATPICVEHLSKLQLCRPVIVAPNEATIQMASDVAAGLEVRTGASVGFAVTVESGPSRGTDRYVHRAPGALAPEESRIELVGSVAGCDVVLVDQMVDTAGTMMRRVKLLKDAGARRVVAFATHGLFNSGALARITRSPISDVIVTNTVPLRDDVDVRHTHKLVQLSVAPLLSEAILRVQMELSLQALRTPSYASSKSPRYKGQE